MLLKRSSFYPDFSVRTCIRFSYTVCLLDLLTSRILFSLISFSFLSLRPFKPLQIIVSKSQIAFLLACMYHNLHQPVFNSSEASVCSLLNELLSWSNTTSLSSSSTALITLQSSLHQNFKPLISISPYPFLSLILTLYSALIWKGKSLKFHIWVPAHNKILTYSLLGAFHTSGKKGSTSVLSTSVLSIGKIDDTAPCFRDESPVPRIRRELDKDQSYGK